MASEERKNRLREYIKEKGIKVGGDQLDALNSRLDRVIADSASRASSGNKRRLTV